MPNRDLESVIDLSHAALAALIRGDSKPCDEVFSHRDDVTLGNPFGPFARGWEQVADAAARAASRYRDGEIVRFEPVARYVTPEMACLVEVERFRAKVGTKDEMASVALRVTSVFRPEDGSWRLVHRHADPITTPQSAESVIGE